MSNYENGAREALHKYWRKKQDEAFERNAVLRQKMWGIIICLLVIVFQAASGSIWWVGISIAALVPGIYLIFNEGRLK